MGAGACRVKREGCQNKNKGRLDSLINLVSPLKNMQSKGFLFNFSFLFLLDSSSMLEMLGVEKHGVFLCNQCV